MTNLLTTKTNEKPPDHTHCTNTTTIIKDPKSITHLKAEFVIQTDIALNPQVLDWILAVHTFEIHFS